MIRSIIVTNYLGDSIELELARPDKSGFAVTSVTGIGPGTATINTTDISTNDGALYNSARVDSRNIVLGITYLWKNSIEEARHLSYKYFPLKNKCTLRFVTDTRECEIDGYVESNDPDMFTSDETTEISVICPNPFFYSAGDNAEARTDFWNVEPMFEFPFSNESLTEPLLIMGEILTYYAKNIPYYGDADIGVTMTIHAYGTAKNISIYNTDTRETMTINTDRIKTITGTAFGTGDDIEISTVKGNKYIKLLRGGIYTNILNCLDKDADWFQLHRGNNNFAYSAESGATNIRFVIKNRLYYEGV